jgi:hypothetical protein
VNDSLKSLHLAKITHRYHSQEHFGIPEVSATQIATKYDGTSKIGAYKACLSQNGSVE